MLNTQLRHGHRLRRGRMHCSAPDRFVRMAISNDGKMLALADAVGMSRRTSSRNHHLNHMLRWLGFRAFPAWALHAGTVGRILPAVLCVYCNPSATLRPGGREGIYIYIAKRVWIENPESGPIIQSKPHMDFRTSDS